MLVRMRRDPAWPPRQGVQFPGRQRRTDLQLSFHPRSNEENDVNLTGNLLLMAEQNEEQPLIWEHRSHKDNASIFSLNYVPRQIV